MLILAFGSVSALCAYSQISSFSLLELAQLSGTAVAGRRWLAEDASGLMPVASRQRFPKALTIELQGVRTTSALLLSVDDVVEVPTR